MFWPIKFWFIMLRPIMSWPIMLEELSNMLYMLCWEDMSFIWSLCIMLFEDMSRPIRLYMLGLTIELSRREEESMMEVILVWMRSGSTERLILSWALLLSALSCRMWNPLLLAIYSTRLRTPSLMT